MADIYGPQVDEDDFEKPDDLYDASTDAQVIQAYWFKGEIERAESERLIMQVGLPGNYLVRKRKGANNIFVHSYHSLSQQKVVHNLVKFQQGDVVLVDGQPFSATALGDIVMKIQSRLREWRKLTFPDDALKQRCLMGWPLIFKPQFTKVNSWEFLRDKPPGAFLLRDAVGHKVISMMKAGAANPDMLYHAPINECPQGAFIKGSELIAKNCGFLVEIMMANMERARAAGLPHDMLMPRPAPPPGAAPVRPPPVEMSDEIYGADDGIGDEVEDDVYGADAAPAGNGAAAELDPYYLDMTNEDGAVYGDADDAYGSVYGDGEEVYGEEYGIGEGYGDASEYAPGEQYGDAYGAADATYDVAAGGGGGEAVYGANDDIDVYN